MPHRKLIVLTVLILLVRSAAADSAATAPNSSYSQPGVAAVAVATYDWHDTVRNCTVPAKVYYPAEGAGPFPVILFSHGLGGSREGYGYLGRQWASHGYVSVHVTHIGSDTSVLQNPRPMEAMRQAAADPRNILNRPKDISFAIDQLTVLNQNDPHLKGRLALDKIGISGHSFGGYTTLAVAGEMFSVGGGTTLGDARVKAALALSPPAKNAPPAELDKNFGAIKIPCFVMTGTLDDSPIGNTKAADRRLPFDHLRLADHYLMILNGGNHMIFAGSSLRFGAGAQDETFHAVIRAGSTAFWDAYLKGDAAAKTWLAEGGFKKLLDSAGTFEQKAGETVNH